MRKYLPYILGTVVLIALSALLLSTVDKKRKLNERITLKQHDKIPYGFYTARQLLPSLFPAARIYNDRRPPGYWDSLSLTRGKQALVLVGDLKADRDELVKLTDLASRGNHVFIISKSLSYEALRYFGFSQSAITWDEGYGSGRDSLRISLSAPRLLDTQTYIYPGRRFSGFFNSLNTSALVLGRNEDGEANFIQLKAGEGFIYLHLAPLAFSNYFILHKNNIRYFQQALSVIPGDIEKLAWNEFYLTKKETPRGSPPSMLRVLFQYEAFRWAFLVALGTLLLYVLLQMRRKQRMIPVLHKAKNESLDFVKTIGRLYYGQKNHKDLAQKMSTHFLDHVRNKYKVATTELDESFVVALSVKSNYSLQPIRELLEYAEQAFGDPSVSENDLAAFHQRLEKFYSTT